MRRYSKLLFRPLCDIKEPKAIDRLFDVPKSTVLPLFLQEGAISEKNYYENSTFSLTTPIFRDKAKSKKKPNLIAKSPFHLIDFPVELTEEKLNSMFEKYKKEPFFGIFVTKSVSLYPESAEKIINSYIHCCSSLNRKPHIEPFNQYMISVCNLQNFDAVKGLMEFMEDAGFKLTSKTYVNVIKLSLKKDLKFAMNLFDNIMTNCPEKDAKKAARSLIVFCLKDHSYLIPRIFATLENNGINTESLHALLVENAQTLSQVNLIFNDILNGGHQFSNGLQVSFFKRLEKLKELQNNSHLLTRYQVIYINRLLQSGHAICFQTIDFILSKGNANFILSFLERNSELLTYIPDEKLCSWILKGLKNIDYGNIGLLSNYLCLIKKLDLDSQTLNAGCLKFLGGSGYNDLLLRIYYEKTLKDSTCLFNSHDSKVRFIEMELLNRIDIQSRLIQKEFLRFLGNTPEESACIFKMFLEISNAEQIGIGNILLPSQCARKSSINALIEFRMKINILYRHFISNGIELSDQTLSRGILSYFRLCKLQRNILGSQSKIPAGEWSNICEKSDLFVKLFTGIISEGQQKQDMKYALRNLENEFNCHSKQQSID